jgi:deazaflavin-dependent oxidoreductase (nitroreductase family)
MSDWNKDIIEEFRGNEGNVGGMFEGRPLLLLHHVGAKSGTERVSPLMYQTLGDGFAIFASKGGAEQNPAWFHNLKSSPETTVEIGTETVTVRARVAEDEEHDRIWAQQKRDFSFFAEYEQKTSRSKIPVVILEPL